MIAGRGMPTVATVMEPDARWRLDAVVEGRATALHTSSISEAIRTVRERPVQAVLVSPRLVARHQLPGITRLIKGFPGTPTLAVLAEHDAETSERFLEFGAMGIREVIDITDRAGWERLRELMTQPTGQTAAAILGKVIPALGQPTSECREFFQLLVRLAPATNTVRKLASMLGVAPSTFVSRFFRAELPSPKRYLAAIRLVFAAALMEATGRSISDVAYRLEFSSPQSFGRHLRTALGMTAAEFRRRYPFPVAVDEFVSRLIVPFRAAFRTFQPLDQG